MAIALDILSWICILSGAGLGITSGIGLLRLPDLFTRMHAAGVGDTLGAGLIVLGMAFQAGFSLNLIKLVLIIVFIFFTSPTSTHALAKAALHGGEKPLLGPKKDAASSKT
jgi:multicomponent Na+:H+ antiporter subunit G